MAGWLSMLTSERPVHDSDASAGWCGADTSRNPVPSPSSVSRTPHERGRMNVMPPIKRFDHVGITVADLDAVTAFFVGLGLETWRAPLRA